ncbi:MFS general substrate transporter [Nadsonia fulvescens var. elongata DSM 6958]|uniref:MFS general substrate transporter n=1 Tax=Nadsonia fulvescens var. elongata DSM 6958 TaxID=857566 RepID=A0A1E3PSJ6_9ASCO|nr:MFS general substrate transporter [Nadsonia fulvescens var. elongata DSM 6958]
MTFSDISNSEGTEQRSVLKRGIWGTLLYEAGVDSLVHSSCDVKLLLAQRFIRLVAFGQTTLILALFFRELEISDYKIGIFMTLTLFGDVLLSYFLTLYADDMGRRTVIYWGVLLMIISGLVFAFSNNYWYLLIAAIIGVISPSGDETGPFKSIEESTLAHLTPHNQISDIFAWHGLFGTLGVALGSVSSGFIIHYLQETLLWSKLDAYRFIFLSYSSMAVIKLVLTFFLSDACEVGVMAHHQGDANERSALLQYHSQNNETDNTSSAEEEKPNWLNLLWGKPLSKESHAIIYKLCFIFSLDSLGYGVMNNSWLVVYFIEKFKIHEETMGTVIFTTNIISSFSSLASSAIYKRTGPIKAIVFTHFPSALFMSLIPACQTIPWAMVLLLLRSCTQSMDVVPRSAFLSSIVHPEERTKVMGIVNIVKTLARSIGPILTGILSEKGVMWIGFLITGICEAGHDFGLLVAFLWVDKFIAQQVANL